MRAGWKGLRRRLKVYAAGVLVLGVAAIVLDVRCFLESRCFYFPMREEHTAPPGAEDVHFTTPDGLTLHGWYLPPRPPRDGHNGNGPAPAVLHVHGNAGHIGYHLEFSEFLTYHGVGVLIFDYRGYGRSDIPRRALQRRDLLTDTLAALEHLKGRPDVDPSRIAIYGVSLGGVLGLAAAAESPEVRAVVSVAAFATWRGIAGHHGTSLGRLAIKPGLDSVASIESMGRRGDPPSLLLVHGIEDTIVPLGHGEQLLVAAEAAGVPARLIRTASGHNDVVVEDGAARTQIAAFLGEVLGPGGVGEPARPGSGG